MFFDHQEKMDTISPPSKIARLSYSSSGSGSDSGSGCLRMERNGSPQIGLGLALGTGGGPTEQEQQQKQMQRRSYGFTILQMQELRLQTVIYKYIEAGCAVPYNLVLPIWRCVSNSFGNINCSMFYPNFMRGNMQMQMEYRKGMDSEPGRCRRTDGKKWRCSREAVLDQKYCERHMNRGRQRTKKLMEVAAEMNTHDHASTNLSISLTSQNK